MIELQAGNFGWDYILQDTNSDQSILIQTDWDYPNTASLFGYVPCQYCDDTDGTVDCAHKTVDQMLMEASEYLDDHIGDVVEDPGYFE